MMTHIVRSAPLYVFFLIILGCTTAQNNQEYNSTEPVQPTVTATLTAAAPTATPVAPVTMTATPTRAATPTRSPAAIASQVIHQYLTDKNSDYTKKFYGVAPRLAKGKIEVSYPSQDDLTVTLYMEEYTGLNDGLTTIGIDGPIEDIVLIATEAQLYKKRLTVIVVIDAYKYTPEYKEKLKFMYDDLTAITATFNYSCTSLLDFQHANSPGGFWNYVESHEVHPLYPPSVREYSHKLCP